MVESAGARTLQVEEVGGRVSLTAALKALTREGVGTVLVEGGATVHGSFVDASVVDEVMFFVAPLLLGGAAPSAVAGNGISELGLAKRLCFESFERIGDDVALRAVAAEVAGVHRAG